MTKHIGKIVGAMVAPGRRLSALIKKKPEKDDGEPLVGSRIGGPRKPSPLSEAKEPCEVK